NLEDENDSATVSLTGFDSEGRRSLIETGDIDVEADDGLTVDTDGLGELVVSTDRKATTDEGPASGNVKLTLGDVSTSTPGPVVTDARAGLVAADPSTFTNGADRATGSFAASEPTPEGPPSIDGDYGLPTPAAPRGYYLIPKEPVELDGNTLALEMKVRGDGSGAWPRLQVSTADGTVTNIDGDHISFDGWQKIRFEVPDGLSQPLTLERIRILETR